VKRPLVNRRQSSIEILSWMDETANKPLKKSIDFMPLLKACSATM
jgi:hypothetical protein